MRISPQPIGVDAAQPLSLMRQTKPLVALGQAQPGIPLGPRVDAGMPLSLGMSSAAPTTQQQVPFSYQPPAAPTPFGNFNPGAVTLDPGFNFRLSEGQKGMERGAAARGTLFSGGFQKGLEKFRQDYASNEYGNAYQRALSTYGANRDTHNANVGAAANADRFNLGAAESVYDRNVAAQREQDQQAEQLRREEMIRQELETQRSREQQAANEQQARDEYARLMEDFQRQVAATHRQNESLSAFQRRPIGPGGPLSAGVRGASTPIRRLA